MNDEPKRLTEQEFDELYGSANESPLHFTLKTCPPSTRCTFGRRWRMRPARIAVERNVTGNVVGHWISLKPWDDELDKATSRQVGVAIWKTPSADTVAAPDHSEKDEHTMDENHKRSQPICRPSARQNRNH